MLKVWGRRTSQNVQKVMWLIGELGLPHEHVDLGGEFGGLDDPAHLARNPHGLIPVIEDEDGVVWESQTILRYLAAKHGGNAWWPDDLMARSHVDRWVDWGMTTLQNHFIDFFWAYYRTPEARRDARYLEGAYGRCIAAFRVLDAHMGNKPYMLGDDFSLADIPAGANLYRFFTLDIDRPSLPHAEAYYERLQERPAYQEHVMVPYDSLKGRIA